MRRRDAPISAVRVNRPVSIRGRVVEYSVHAGNVNVWIRLTLSTTILARSNVSYSPKISCDLLYSLAVVAYDSVESFSVAAAASGRVTKQRIAIVNSDYCVYVIACGPCTVQLVGADTSATPASGKFRRRAVWFSSFTANRSLLHSWRHDIFAEWFDCRPSCARRVITRTCTSLSLSLSAVHTRTRMAFTIPSTVAMAVTSSGCDV